MADPAPSPRLVLASGSPRRRELLATLGLHPEVRPSNVDETRRLGESPDGYVTRLAALKAGFAVGSGEAALGADTVVVLGDDILGKPTDESDAVAMLTRLSGGTHRVFTAQAVVARDPGGAFTHRLGALSTTEVTFRQLSAAEVEAYVATGEPMDKAGAYGIQGGAGGFVDRIDGRRDTVIGLDLQWTRRLLAGVGIDPADPDPPGSGAATTDRGATRSA
ncbi:MAG: Maf family protein [Microthrixaceae bacterium]|nr:septum formation protein Maf [Microthrixaceae bacterium]